jgi:hypothetical protein
VQEGLKPAAALSIVVYTVGLPVAFLAILLKHRHAIQADQTLRAAHGGTSPATNPNFHIRRRYQELYRFVLLARLQTLCKTRDQPARLTLEPAVVVTPTACDKAS